MRRPALRPLDFPAVPAGIPPDCRCSACRTFDWAYRMHTEAVRRGHGSLTRGRLVAAGHAVDKAHGLLSEVAP
jgi:hypothetical protein